MTAKQKQLLLCCFDCLSVGGVDGIWGPQSESATRKLQHKLGIPETGIFDRNTEGETLAALAESWGADSPDSWWAEIEFFAPEEFACKCGGFCDGYPHEIQPSLVRIADRARKYFGQPITVISGLRCPQHNARVGGVSNSQHMFGEAADIHVRGVDPDRVLSWFQSQKDVRYAYRISGTGNIHFDIEKVGR